jgi:hypothetical protein
MNLRDLASHGRRMRGGDGCLKMMLLPMAMMSPTRLYRTIYTDHMETELVKLQ